MPLPQVYQAFPDLLQPLNSISAEAQAETRAQRWTERAMRIRDDVLSWTLCSREWKEAEQEVEEGSPLNSVARRHARVCKDRADRELLNLAWRIDFEGNREEKCRMPHPSEPPVAFVHWAKQEAKSTDRGRAERWDCIIGQMPTRTPPPPEPVDPLPYRSPLRATD
jgi:hypothetical protein